jgi:hypothetical protein
MNYCMFLTVDLALVVRNNMQGRSSGRYSVDDMPIHDFQAWALRSWNDPCFRC